MDFYSFLIERFIEWMYGAIKESNMASIWKILVAYQKIVTVMEHIGIERALGTVRSHKQRWFVWFFFNMAVYSPSFSFNKLIDRC